MSLRTRHEWLGWDESGNLIFHTANASTDTIRADVTILALGGASWSKLGSDGGWAAILAVPTAVAGIYGMNFKNIPELEWSFGYPASLLLMLAICSILYYCFRRAAWL